MKSVTLLGSTGSIGTQTIDVVSRATGYRITGLAAGGANVELLAQQVIQTGARTVAVARTSAVGDLQLALYAHAQRSGYASGEYQLPTILAGPEASSRLAAQHADVVVNGMTGAAGLEPTLAALEAGNRLALANKESLIIGGPLVKAAAHPGQIVPVDSEHSAIAQCLRGGTADEVKRLVLTASGGPFRGRTRNELQDVTPEEAAAHPTWDMGPVITINSATLVNKGLEVIEAHLLFDLPLERIDVVIHPQSIVHSMVEYVDGSTIAQASPPDMRLPIALGLSWPQRLAGASIPCDWTSAQTWTFEPLDEQTFPAISWARLAAAAGGTAPAVFNAANEACVDEFIAGNIGFLDIVDTVGHVLEQHIATKPEDGKSDGHVGSDVMTLENVKAADAWAREFARAAVTDQS